MLIMFKRLKKMYIGNKGIKFIRKEIESTRAEIKGLRELVTDGNSEYNRLLNKQITDRYKLVFKLYNKIDEIHHDMFK